MDDSLLREFLLDLFHGAEKHMLRWEVIGIPMNKAGLELSDLTLSDPGNFTSSCVFAIHLVVALWLWTEFRSGDHTMLLK